MALLRSMSLVVLLWAGIYLPGLGTAELKGEEGRRVLPGLTMIESGNWLLPWIGGREYHRKPPLVNWLAAKSVQWTGQKTEWAVRLPSALAVLLLGISIVVTGRVWLGDRGALAASIFCLTNIGVMEKGRLIEIEALYVALFGIALVWWIGAMARNRSAWAMWLPACFFLGLGLLTKGPLHLLFFYAVVISILVASGSLCKLRHPAHWTGLLLAVGIFAMWAVPALRMTEDPEVTSTWGSQFTGRLDFSSFRPGRWLYNLFRATLNFIPWVCLLAIAWNRTGGSGRARAGIERGLKWGLVIGFLAVMLAPGALPRYVLPLVVPASLLLAAWWCGPASAIPAAVPRIWSRWNFSLAWVVCAAALVLPWIGGFAWSKVAFSLVSLAVIAPLLRLPGAGVGARVLHGGDRRWFPESASAAIMVAASILYCTAVLPIVSDRPGERTEAAMILEHVPAESTLWFFNPEYQPVLFYLPHPVEYVLRRDRIPAEATALIVRERHIERILELEAWKSAEEIHLRHAEKKSSSAPVLLLRNSPARPNPPASRPEN